jgi:hypothetical protein
MKITRNSLKELIRQSIREIDFKDKAAFDKYDKKHKMRANTKVKIGGKKTTVGQAIDVGGPSHANVPKKGGSKVKGPKPGGEFTIDQVMNAKIGKDTVGDILDNPKHPNYDKAEEYSLQFNPDDEKVVSGGGPKVKGPKPGGEFTIDKVMGATIGKEKVSDLLGDEEHPDHEAAFKYVMQFNPDDEKVISGKGGKPDSISASDWEMMDADEREYHTSGQYDKDAEGDDTGKDDEPYTDDDEDHGGDSKKESVRESNNRRTTVKEVKKWFKTLEENRYKKTYGSDARRVSWMVNNNLSEDYEAMPVSMKKKWPKAAYKRERFLAKEFVKHLKGETKLRESIRRIIKKQIRG